MAGGHLLSAVEAAAGTTPSPPSRNTPNIRASTGVHDRRTTQQHPVSPSCLCPRLPVVQSARCYLAVLAGHAWRRVKPNLKIGYNAGGGCMLPAFDERGNLPPGIHEATWAAVVARFGTSPERRLLLVQLRAALDALAASGCRRAWLDGSFVGDVERRLGRPPGDGDVGWELAGVDLRRLAALSPALRPLRGSREERRRRWRSGFWRASSAIGRVGRRGSSSCT